MDVFLWTPYSELKKSVLIFFLCQTLCIISDVIFLVQLPGDGGGKKESALFHSRRFSYSNQANNTYSIPPLPISLTLNWRQNYYKCLSDRRLISHISQAAT